MRVPSCVKCELIITFCSLLFTGVSSLLAEDNKRFTTIVYGNGPGFQINGTRPDVNETISSEFSLILCVGAILRQN